MTGPPRRRVGKGCSELENSGCRDLFCRVKEHPFDAYGDVLIRRMFLPPGWSVIRGRFEAGTAPPFVGSGS
jgi:hypothetical protein